MKQIQPKTNSNQLWNYLLKPLYYNQKIENYLEQHDEIKASLQVLSTILTIVYDKCTYLEIKNIFDCEENTTIEDLRHELEDLLSSYTDELSFIHEQCSFYLTCLNEEKNFYWTQIIENDYPSLIARVSNDFVTKVPQIDQILLKMLSHVKERLRYIDAKSNNKIDHQ